MLIFHWAIAYMVLSKAGWTSKLIFEQCSQFDQSEAWAIAQLELKLKSNYQQVNLSIIAAKINFNLSIVSSFWLVEFGALLKNDTAGLPYFAHFPLSNCSHGFEQSRLNQQSFFEQHSQFNQSETWAIAQMELKLKSNY